MDITRPNMVVICEESGVIREAFAAMGFNAFSCDLKPSKIPGQHLQCDALEIIDWDWDLIIAHPPCTYLTVTGNKWMKEEYRHRFPDRQQRRTDAMAFFMAIANAKAKRICIENPVGVMSTAWRKPNQIICPTDFGHVEPKRTCLWLKNLPPILNFNQSQETPEYVTLSSGKRLPAWWFNKSNDQAKNAEYRSRTFPNIALAMAEQWGEIIMREVYGTD